jgi:hypothetical protein
MEKWIVVYLWLWGILQKLFYIIIRQALSDYLPTVIGSAILSTLLLSLSLNFGITCRRKKNFHERCSGGRMDPKLRQIVYYSRFTIFDNFCIGLALPGINNIKLAKESAFHHHFRESYKQI